jgi:Flp pilus assembly pilin Flp
MDRTGILLKLRNEESAQDLMEYALIAAFIALAAIVLMSSIGNTIGNLFHNISSNI